MPEPLVHVRDHPEERSRPLPLVRLDELRPLDVRAVRGVRRQVAEERLALLVPLLHPRGRGIEPQVRAVPGEALGPAVVEVAAVEQRVVELRRGVAHPEAEVVRRLLKPLVVRPVRVVVAQVPLAEQPRLVPRGREHLGRGWNARPEERPPGGDGRRAVPKRVHARQQLPAGGGTHRGDVEVGKPNRFGGEPIEARRLQHRVAGVREVAHALVVGDDDQDVRLASRRPGRAGGRGKQ